MKLRETLLIAAVGVACFLLRAFFTLSPSTFPQPKSHPSIPPTLPRPRSPNPQPPPPTDNSLRTTTIFAFVHIPKCAGSTFWSSVLQTSHPLSNTTSPMFSFKAFDDANGVHQTNHRLKGAARNTIVPKLSPTNLSSPSPPNLFFPSSAYQSFNAMHCRLPPEPYSESDDVFEVKKLGTHCTRSELHGCLSSRRASIFGESDVEQTQPNGTPVEIKYVTLIRDPIDRVLSEYYWGREHGLSQREKARRKEMEKETGINSNQQFSQQHQQKSSKKPSNKLRNKKRTREVSWKYSNYASHDNRSSLY